MPEMHKKFGVTVFVSDIERVVNYPDFDKLAYVIWHDLQGFIVRLVSKRDQSPHTWQTT